MMIQLILATIMVVVTVLIHSAGITGLLLLGWLMAYFVTVVARLRA
jgi:hypothetical protein